MEWSIHFCILVAPLAKTLGEGWFLAPCTWPPSLGLHGCLAYKLVVPDHMDSGLLHCPSEGIQRQGHEHNDQTAPEATAFTCKQMRGPHPGWEVAPGVTDICPQFASSCQEEAQILLTATSKEASGLIFVGALC